MSLRAVTPAPIGDVVTVYTATAPMKPVNVAAMILQHARSTSIAYYADDDLLAVAMFYPLDPERPDEDLAELTLACLPALAHHMIPFIRLARLTRARLANDGHVRIRAHIRTGHRPGARLARLCGMVPVGVSGSFQRWEFEGRSDECICERRADTVHRP